MVPLTGDPAPYVRWKAAPRAERNTGSHPPAPWWRATGRPPTWPRRGSARSSDARGTRGRYECPAWVPAGAGPGTGLSRVEAADGEVGQGRTRVSREAPD